MAGFKFQVLLCVRLIQSTLALRTPRYCGHPANTDNCWINPRLKLQTFDWNKISLLRILAITDLQTRLSVPTAQFYCSNSPYNGHPSASFDILTELSQIIIHFFLFLSSSLSLWLKSEHSDSRLTWSFHETTVLTCKKQSWCTKCTEIGFSSALLYGFCDLQIFQWLFRWMKGRCKLCSVTIYRVCK